jgi:hypothetical protein
VTIDSTVEDKELDGLSMQTLVIEGGSSNSIHLKDCKILTEIRAQKDPQNGEPPRIFLKGNTTVQKIAVWTPTIIEAEDENVPQIPSIEAKATTTIKGKDTKVASVAIYAGESDTETVVPTAVVVEGGTISEVAAYDDATVTVAAGATVATVTANDSVEVAGAGTIANVVVPEDAKDDVKVTVADDATVSNLEVNKNAAVENNGTVTAVSKGSDEITVTTSGDNQAALDTAVAAAHTHSWGDGEETTPATCEEAGVMTYTCSNEGCTYTDGKRTEVIPALGHAWNTGEETTPATETTDGVRTYTCQNDKTHTYTVAIPATGSTDDTEKPGTDETEKPGTDETETPGGNTETTLPTLSPNFNNGKFELSVTLADTTDASYKFERQSDKASQTVSMANYPNGFSTFAANFVDFANLSSHNVSSYTNRADTSVKLVQVGDVVGLYKDEADTTYYVDLGTSTYTVASGTKTVFNITVVDAEGTALSTTADPTFVVNEQLAAFSGETPTINYADGKLTIASLTSGDYAVLIKQGTTVNKVVATATESGWSAALPDGVSTSADTSVYIVKLEYSSSTITATGLGGWITNITGWETTSI